MQELGCKVSKFRGFKSSGSLGQVQFVRTLPGLETGMIEAPDLSFTCFPSRRFWS